MKRFHPPTRFALILGLFAFSAACRAAEDFALKNGDRVVFYGDSITDQRLYTTFTETYVVTRFPKLDVSFVHSGWGGDRVTGGGGGPIDVRLDRDVFAYKPTVVTIMLGMNDASYRPFDQGTFDVYSKGYRHLVESIKSHLPGVRLTLIQPSPFDDVTRPPSFPEGYNAVLVKYGEFVKDLAQKEGAGVADLNTPVVASLKKAAELDKTHADKLIADRVHPGPGGQLLMAEALLKAWRAPAVVTAVEIDLGGSKVIRSDNTKIEDLKTKDGVSWTQVDAASPMPIDFKDPVVALAVKASDVIAALNQETLKVYGVTAGKYELKIDGQKAGEFSMDALLEGINLAELDTPMTRQARDVHHLTIRHNDVHFQRWRMLQTPFEKDGLPSLAKALEGLDSLERDLIEKQRAAAVPKPHKYELIPKP